MTSARGTDAQTRCPTGRVAGREGFLKAFVDIELGDAIIPWLRQRGDQLLPLSVLHTPGRRAAGAGRGIGHWFVFEPEGDPSQAGRPL